MESEVEFENVEINEVAKYLAINLSKDDQRLLNIISCIPDGVVELEGNARGEGWDGLLSFKERNLMARK